MKKLIHVYTGNGKGKTTAALGLALRAAGNGMKTFIGQFMKGYEYSEIKALKCIKEIDIQQFGWENCIRKEDVRGIHHKKTVKGLEFCSHVMASEEYDIVILDEILVSIWFGLISVVEVIDLIGQYAGSCELVLTGRYAPQEIIDIADLVTEMRCIKHYYDQGVLSRLGIEY